jgi:hypothetical protein
MSVETTDPDDSFWVDCTSEINVFLSPVRAAEYQVWLREHNLHLFKLPGSDADAPIYTIGVRWLVGDTKSEENWIEPC